eukprot:284814560_1
MFSTSSAAWRSNSNCKTSVAAACNARTRSGGAAEKSRRAPNCSKHRNTGNSKYLAVSVVPDGFSDFKPLPPASLDPPTASCDAKREHRHLGHEGVATVVRELMQRVQKSCPQGSRRGRRSGVKSETSQISQARDILKCCCLHDSTVDLVRVLKADNKNWTMAELSKKTNQWGNTTYFRVVYQVAVARVPLTTSTTSRLLTRPFRSRRWNFRPWPFAVAAQEPPPVLG